MRLTIKLMIHSFKRESDWPLAFQEYTKVTQTAVLTPGQPLIQKLSQILLINLSELLDIMVPKGLTSGDEPVLAILRQTFNQSNNRHFLNFNQAFLGALIDYFCTTAKNKPQVSLAPNFIKEVIKLTKI